MTTSIQSTTIQRLYDGPLPIDSHVHVVASGAVDVDALTYILEGMRQYQSLVFHRREQGRRSRWPWVATVARGPQGYEMNAILGSRGISGYGDAVSTARAAAWHIEHGGEC